MKTPKWVDIPEIIVGNVNRRGVATEGHPYNDYNRILRPPLMIQSQSWVIVGVALRGHPSGIVNRVQRWGYSRILRPPFMTRPSVCV
jgi:hypothetical protein